MHLAGECLLCDSIGGASDIAKLLAKQLGLRQSQVVLVAGPASPRKEFLITGLDCAELARRLQ